MWVEGSTGSQEVLGAEKAPLVTGLRAGGQALDSQAKGILTGEQCGEQAKISSPSKSLPFLLNFNVFRESS